MNYAAQIDSITGSLIASDPFLLRPVAFAIDGGEQAAGMIPRASKGLALLLMIVAVGICADNPATIKNLQDAISAKDTLIETLTRTNEELRRGAPIREGIEDTKAAVERNQRQALRNQQIIDALRAEWKDRSFQDRCWNVSIMVLLLLLTFLLVHKDHRMVEGRQSESFSKALDRLTSQMIDSRTISLGNTQQAAKERNALSEKMDRGLQANADQIQHSNAFNEKLKFAKRETEETIAKIDVNVQETKTMVADIHETR